MSSPVAGTDLEVVEIGTEPGAVVRVLALGASVASLVATCGDGVRRNVVLGHATAHEYAAGVDYVGGIVGRFANRIAGGRFILDGHEVRASVVAGSHHLHGDPDGWHRRPWSIVSHTPDEVRLRLVSPDGDQGMPGRVEIEAVYTVVGSQLGLDLRATTDSLTVLNPTAHHYFDLAGRDDGSARGDVLDHDLEVAASSYLPVDDTAIPLGRPADVTGTPFDFRAVTTVRRAVTASHPQVRAAGGLDHTLVLDPPAAGATPVRPVAWLSSPRTSTTLEIATDQPGLQVYTGNAFDGAGRDADGRALCRHAGIALETQHFPDSPHHPSYPSTVLRAGQTYRTRTTWTIGPLQPRASSTPPPDPAPEHRRQP